MSTRPLFFRERSLALKAVVSRIRGPKPKKRFAEGSDGTGDRCVPIERYEPDNKGLIQRLRRSFPGHWGARRAVCKKCHMELYDCEPAAHRAEYWHPRGSTCALARQRVEIEDTVPFAYKKYRRARRRGARSASKHRPR